MKTSSACWHQASAFGGGRGMARALKPLCRGGFAGQLWLVQSAARRTRRRTTLRKPASADACRAARTRRSSPPTAKLRPSTRSPRSPPKAPAGRSAIPPASPKPANGAWPCNAERWPPPAKWRCSARTATACSTTCTAPRYSRWHMAVGRWSGASRC
ncbi:hypothetical protein ACPA9J_05375 [Pseudomonas aeruginosa]